MTYEEKVRQRAEELAKETHPDTWLAARESLIEFFTPAARISVQREADTAKYAFAWPIENLFGMAIEDYQRHLDNYLQDEGLIS